MYVIKNISETAIELDKDGVIFIIYIEQILNLDKIFQIIMSTDVEDDITISIKPVYRDDKIYYEVDNNLSSGSYPKKN